MLDSEISIGDVLVFNVGKHQKLWPHISPGDHEVTIAAKVGRKDNVYLFYQDIWKRKDTGSFDSIITGTATAEMFKELENQNGLEI
jgi:hypothetical protein